MKLEKCEECGWCKKRGSDQKIPVQLHHKNGDTSDNRLENLTILCPNCHSLTENYCGKNKANSRRRSQFEQQKEYYQTPKNTCTVCGKLGYGTAFCSNECRGMSQRVTERPSKEQLEIEIESFSWVALGKKYGVSDKAVRKWAISYGILS